MDHGSQPAARLPLSQLANPKRSGPKVEAPNHRFPRRGASFGSKRKRDEGGWAGFVSFGLAPAAGFLVSGALGLVSRRPRKKKLLHWLGVKHSSLRDPLEGADLNVHMQLLPAFNCASS